MAILEKDVLVKPFNNKNFYLEKGYFIPTYLDKTGTERVSKKIEILVKVEDLVKGSHVKVTKICDECGEYVYNQPYIAIIKCREFGDGKDRCHKCGKLKGSITQKDNVKYEKSLEYYSKQNNKEYLINEFSSNNKKKPNEISYGSADEYLWNCPKCKTEYPMSPHKRTSPKSCGCPYCSKKRINRTNCLWNTHPEIAKLLKNPEKGYEVTAGSGNSVDFICPICKHKKNKKIWIVTRYGLSCNKCSDGISYPEKFMFSLLEQLELNAEKRIIFDWSKNIQCQNRKLNGNKEYDFYIPSLNCIIETHGEQHYKYGFKGLGGRTLEEEQENDRVKERLAKDNGIKNYIVIDCRISEMKYIKDNILKSNLNTLLDLKNVNWNECHEYACNSLVKKVCDIWNTSGNTASICKELKIDRSTVIKYLKQGKLLNWCDYNPKEVMKRNGQERINNLLKHTHFISKKIVQLSLDGDYLNTFPSTMEVERHLGIIHSNVSRVCMGKTKHAGGYQWMYEEDYNILLKENKSVISIEKPKIIQLSIDGSFIKKHNNVMDAAKSLSKNNSGNITYCCLGKVKSAYGYKWMYKEDYDQYINNKIAAL